MYVTDNGLEQIPSWYFLENFTDLKKKHKFQHQIFNIDGRGISMVPNKFSKVVCKTGKS